MPPGSLSGANLRLYVQNSTGYRRHVCERRFRRQILACGPADYAAVSSCLSPLWPTVDSSRTWPIKR